MGTNDDNDDDMNNTSHNTKAVTNLHLPTKQPMYCYGWYDMITSCNILNN